MRPLGFPRGDPARLPDMEPIIQLMDNWFWAIEDGSAQRRVPDVNGERYPEWRVNSFIRDLDYYCSYQISASPHYFTTERGIDVPPEFDRLQGAAREAFMQALKLAKKRYMESLKNEEA